MEIALRLVINVFRIIIWKVMNVNKHVQLGIPNIQLFNYVFHAQQIV